MFALGCQGIAKVIKGGDGGFIEPHRLAEGSHGLGVAARQEQGLTERVPIDSFTRLERHSLLDQTHGGLALTLRVCNPSQQMQRFGVTRFAVQGRPVKSLGAPEVTSKMVLLRHGAKLVGGHGGSKLREAGRCYQRHFALQNGKSGCFGRLPVCP